MKYFLVFLAAMFDRGLDRILADLNKLDTRLARYIELQKSVIEAQDTRIEKAAAKQQKAIDSAKAKFRGTVASASLIAGDAERASERATRVANRIKALIA